MPSRLNPSSVPPPLHRDDQRLAAIPCTLDQIGYLRRLLQATGIDPVDIFGREYCCERHLSVYSASFGIGVLELRKAEQARWRETAEGLALAAAREHYGIRPVEDPLDDAVPRSAYPVYRCAVCRGARPHEQHGGAWRCLSCGSRQEAGA